MKPLAAGDEPSRGPRCPRLVLLAVLTAAHALAASDGENALASPNLIRGSSNMEEFWWADPRDPVRFTTLSSSHYFRQDPRVADVYYFFPPVPPALHSEVPLLGSLLSRGPAAPPGLARYVNEPFYPMLGFWMLTRELPASLSAALAEYTATKTTLQEQLRTRLAELKDAPPEVRERSLADLAQQQAPALAALEARAEWFRARLLASLPDGPRTEWRDFLPGAVQRGDKEYSDSVSLTVQSEATLVAVFYQDGLDPAQRQLLRHTAYNLAREARGGSVSAGNRWVSLTPFPARLQLPAVLPEALEARLVEFQRLQQALVDELQQELRDHRATPETRAAALRKLAPQQAPRFAALEAAAEDIRRGLAALPADDTPAAGPALPAELSERIAKYRRQRDESLKTLHALLAGTRPEGKASPAEFERTQNELLGQLSRENLAIRAALAEHMRASDSPAHRKSVDDLLRSFESARQQQESRAQFRDYQHAVLTPGLSPAQRRLLFDAAVTQLRLPLPAGQKLR
jgi:hypothetical protein